MSNREPPAGEHRTIDLVRRVADADDKFDLDLVLELASDSDDGDVLMHLLEL